MNPRKLNASSKLHPRNWNARHLASAALAAAILASPFFHVQACGPDFEPDTFVRTKLPDDLTRYAQRHLGIIQRNYDSDEYAIAFRYLNGGKLSEAERAKITLPGDPERYEDWRNYEQDHREQAAKQPARLWLLKRAQYTATPVPDQKQSFPQNDFDNSGYILFNPSYLNCPDPAFQNATLTLEKRAAAWGKQSPYLADWIKAQDAVFSNCEGKTPNLPVAAATDSPELLRADRAYQLAAAALYARQYDQAIQQFQAIAADTHSPWQPWGKYLSARALIRKAFATGKETSPERGELAEYNDTTMRQAQQLLESMLATPNPTPSREAIQSQLNLVRIRTETEKRIQEISAAIAGPKTDPNFTQDLADLNFLLLNRPDLKSNAPLLTWIAAWRDKTPPGTSLNLWHTTHSLPWLVTALADATPSDAATPELIAAAEKIEPTSPAYETVLYHRIRLLMGSKSGIEEARTLLDRQLAQMPPITEPAAAHPDYAPSDRNAFLRERFAVARDFPELLHFAPRRDLEATSGAASVSIGECVDKQAQNAKQGQNAPTENCPANQQPLEFDNDAVLTLNQHTPLQLLAEAATSPNLPQNLQQEVALAAWTRAFLLDDDATAQKLAPILPQSLKITPQTATGFPAIVTILRNPGLRPVVEPGISRLDTHATIDNYRDNWWCFPNPSAINSEDSDHPAPKEQPLPQPAIFTPEEQKTAASQYAALLQFPTASFFLGRRVLDYAKAHPADPAVPEALHLTVRATRYGCDSYQETSQAIQNHKNISKTAFQLLHSKYPNSPWTAKTPYYF